MPLEWREALMNMLCYVFTVLGVSEGMLVSGNVRSYRSDYLARLYLVKCRTMRSTCIVTLHTDFVGEQARHYQGVQIPASVIHIYSIYICGSVIALFI